MGVSLREQGLTTGAEQLSRKQTGAGCELDGSEGEMEVLFPSLLESFCFWFKYFNLSDI